MQPIKDQGQCGSCWVLIYQYNTIKIGLKNKKFQAFATTALVEWNSCAVSGNPIALR